MEGLGEGVVEASVVQSHGSGLGHVSIDRIRKALFDITVVTGFPA